MGKNVLLLVDVLRTMISCIQSVSVLARMSFSLFKFAAPLSGELSADRLQWLKHHAHNDIGYLGPFKH